MFASFTSKEKDPLAPQALFSLSWVFAIGLSCLKLSALQIAWEKETWLVFYLIYAGFLLGTLICRKCIQLKTCNQTAAIRPEKAKRACPLKIAFRVFRFPCNARLLKYAVLFLTAVSLVCFLIEACLLGFIPLFTSDTPHAYSTFHISGLHYFTVLCVLVPSFFVAFLEENCRKADTLCILCLIISLMLPILMVSRFQLIFSLILAVLVLIFTNQNAINQKIMSIQMKNAHSRPEKRIRSLISLIRPRTAVLGLLSLFLFVLTYIFLTVERAHSISYLNGIFEMKNAETPIFITQPYIYITNNFDNFNALIRDLPTHTFGLRMLYPLFALTGLKFIYPELVSFPIYITKEELTTVTLFYDSWYDFGTAGSFIFSFLLGAFYTFLYRKLNGKINALYRILYAQLIAYLCLAFFTTWFSNPTTWFYLGITIVTSFILWYSYVKGNKNC